MMVAPGQECHAAMPCLVLASSTSSVVLHTDAERAVSELVGTSSEKYTFMVRRARPQQHQSNGGAERAVRRLKESLAVLRAEMNDGDPKCHGTINSITNIPPKSQGHTFFL